MLPREKLIKYGAQYLTEYELLAIILGVGSSSDNVFDLSKRILADYSNVKELLDVSYEELIKIKGIKMAKKAGLGEAAVKNLKKFYGKALLSYAGYAALAGFATYVASKIMDKFTRPKKVYY